MSSSASPPPRPGGRRDAGEAAVRKTVTASLFAFADRFERDWALTSAASVIMILPVLVLFLAMQRRFIAGLTQGGLKA